MTEQLVSFKIARLAEEKGFNIECEKYYNTENQLWTYTWGDEGLYPEAVFAPTQSLLQKWLREKHRIDIDITRCTIQNNNNGVGYQYEFNENKGEDGGSCFTVFDTYEEALEKGLQEALKLI